MIQFFGGHILAGWPTGWRQPSFLGHHDLAGLSGAAGSVALIWLALPRPGWGRFAAVAAVSGVVGLILSGSTAGAIGFALAALAASVFGKWRSRATRRRLAAIVCLPLVVAAGLVPLRSGDVGHLLRYFGIGPKEKQHNVETLVQRTLLIYIGWREFLHHPVTGSGFESSLEESVYSPYLPAARAKFPGSPPRAFPSPEHPWGVQNLYVQTLAETGVIGFLLLVGVFVAGLWTAGRAALRGPPEGALLPFLWLLVCVGVWNALGTIAGIPMDALTWLALGLAAAAVPKFTGMTFTQLARRAAKLDPSRADYDHSPMAKVLVTGGAGFIGSNLVRALHERGDDVRVLDNFSTGFRGNLESLDVEIVEGELRSYERVHNAVRGTELVYHLGALGSVPRSVQDPLTSSAVNVEGTLNVLLAARDEGVKRVVFSSSTSVYGTSRAAPDDRGSAASTRSPRTASRSSPPSATASPSARVYDAFETVVAPLLQRLRPAAEPVAPSTPR